LNPRHSVPQTDALPAELLPPLPTSLPCSGGAAEGGPISLLDAGTGRAKTPIIPAFLFHSEAILPQYHSYKSVVELAAPDPTPPSANRLARFAEDRSRHSRADPQVLGSEAGASLAGTKPLRTRRNPAAGQAAAWIRHALAEFGGKAKTTLRGGLRQTTGWFESNAKLAIRACEFRMALKFISLHRPNSGEASFALERSCSPAALRPLQAGNLSLNAGLHTSPALLD
jgi:hypothetical protein